MKNKFDIFLNPSDFYFELRQTQPQVATGKFAVKEKSFVDKIKVFQEKINKDYFFKPLTLEFEITNCCNLNCKHCGMNANQKGLIRKTFNDDQIQGLIDSLYENGIPSISITGGEPFLCFNKMLNLFKYSQNKVDICKITTNGFWGEKAQEYFSQMETAGLFNNKLFVPCLMLSIGEQNVPLKNIANIIHYATTNYTIDNLTVCISSLHEVGKKSKLNKLLECYEKEFGEFPKHRVYLTENHYIDNSRNNSPNKKFYSHKHYIDNCVKCFEQTVGKHILPRVLMKADGTCYACACFNVPKQLNIGNFFNDGISKIISNANTNKYIKLISQNGIAGFKNHIPPEVLSQQSDDVCSTCQFCMNYLDKQNFNI